MAENDAKKADNVSRLLADMKVSGASPTAEDKKKSALDDLLEPNEEEEVDSDDGEVIDRSESPPHSP
jgi:uncharacterized protein (UPF0262 family)